MTLKRVKSIFLSPRPLSPKLRLLKLKFKGLFCKKVKIGCFEKVREKILVRSPFASYSFYKYLDLVKLVIGVTYCQGIGGLDLTN